MDTLKSNHHYRLEMILVVFTLVISSLACSLGGVSINQNQATVDLKFSEQDINAMFVRSTTQLEQGSDDLLTSVSSVSLRDGFIRVFGTAINAEGKEVSGSFDVAFSAVDSKLVVQVVAIDMPGITFDDPRIVKANHELASEMVQTVKESNGDVQFTKALVTDRNVQIQIRVNG